MTSANEEENDTPTKIAKSSLPEKEYFERIFFTENQMEKIEIDCTSPTNKSDEISVSYRASLKSLEKRSRDIEKTFSFGLSSRSPTLPKMQSKDALPKKHEPKEDYGFLNEDNEEYRTQELSPILSSRPPKRPKMRSEDTFPKKHERKQDYESPNEEDEEHRTQELSPILSSRQPKLPKMRSKDALSKKRKQIEEYELYIEDNEEHRKQEQVDRNTANEKLRNQKLNMGEKMNNLCDVKDSIVDNYSLSIEVISSQVENVKGNEASEEKKETSLTIIEPVISQTEFEETYLVSNQCQFSLEEVNGDVDDPPSSGEESCLSPTKTRKKKYPENSFVSRFRGVSNRFRSQQTLWEYEMTLLSGYLETSDLPIFIVKELFKRDNQTFMRCYEDPGRPDNVNRSELLSPKSFNLCNMENETHMRLKPGDRFKLHQPLYIIKTEDEIFVTGGSRIELVPE